MMLKRLKKPSQNLVPVSRPPGKRFKVNILSPDEECGCTLGASPSEDSALIFQTLKVLVQVFQTFPSSQALFSDDSEHASSIGDANSEINVVNFEKASETVPNGGLHNTNTGIANEATEPNNSMLCSTSNIAHGADTVSFDADNSRDFANNFTPLDASKENSMGVNLNNNMSRSDATDVAVDAGPIITKSIMPVPQTDSTIDPRDITIAVNTDVDAATSAFNGADSNDFEGDSPISAEASEHVDTGTADASQDVGHNDVGISTGTESCLHSRLPICSHEAPADTSIVINSDDSSVLEVDMVRYDNGLASVTTTGAPISTLADTVTSYEVGQRASPFTESDVPRKNPTSDLGRLEIIDLTLSSPVGSPGVSPFQVGHNLVACAKPEVPMGQALPQSNHSFVSNQMGQLSYGKPLHSQQSQGNGGWKPIHVSQPDGSISIVNGSHLHASFKSGHQSNFDDQALQANRLSHTFGYDNGPLQNPAPSTNAPGHSHSLPGQNNGHGQNHVNPNIPFDPQTLSSMAAHAASFPFPSSYSTPIVIQNIFVFPPHQPSGYQPQ